MTDKLLQIQNMIYEIRGHRVMFDRDLADLYQVEVKTLNRTVKRNIKRFPNDFMFQLSNEEWEILKHHFEDLSLRYQNGTAKKITKIRYNPYVFTEQGIAMLSGLLNSNTAINVNIQIMRAFVRLRQYVFSQSDTNEQIAELRKLLLLHIENSDYKFSKYDRTIKQIVQALNNLIAQPQQKTKTIGFQQGNS